MQLSPDIIARIKDITLQTKKKLMSYQTGEQRSRSKGYGLEFDQLRQYHQGDDIRFIDWKSSARMGELLVKEFIHEYSKTIIICLDVSGSTRFGTTTSKLRLMQEIATVLALAGQHNRARVGLILFADQIITSVPPKASKSHIQLIINAVWRAPQESRKTNIETLLRYIASLKRKDAMVFVLSDFIDQGFEKTVAFLRKKVDLIGIRCLDRLEDTLEIGCYIGLTDSEDDAQFTIDARGNNYAELSFFLKQRLKNQEQAIKKHAMDFMTFWTGKPYIDSLISFFTLRMKQ